MISPDDIFKAYLDDECPVCKSENVNDVGETTHGGKTMSIFMYCINCGSKYTVGFGRTRMPIDSEITVMGTPR